MDNCPLFYLFKPQRVALRAQQELAFLSLAQVASTFFLKEQPLSDY